MRCLCLGLLFLSCLPARAEPGSGQETRPAVAGQWIVVTAPAFRQAVQPLCDHRKEQGLRVVVVQSTDVLTAAEIKKGQADKLRAHLVQLCKDHKGPSYVLLVGAVGAGGLAEPERKVVPAMPGSAGRMKGQPSDNGYGCLDRELLPAVAVGRFPARSEEEARQMVRKTLDFEKDRAPGSWRTRLTVLAGIPAYNPVVDRLVESLALARFDRLDPSWHGRAIYHNASSRFCLPNRQLQAQALKYVQEGQAFTVYFGHSGPEGFYADSAHYLDRGDWARLKIARGGGVFFTFGCNGCQLLGKDGEGYGIAAMRNPHGPVAVAGSHGVCFAAMVQLAADGMFESTFAGKVHERLADSWLALKRGLARGKIDALTYGLLDAVDGDSKIPQATQRLEHLEMFVLLGDPALRLPAVPRDLKLTVPALVSPGTSVTIKGEAPVRLKEGRVRLTVERAVTSLPNDLQALPETPFEGGMKDRIMLANHEKANRFVLVEVEAAIKGGRFEASLKLPSRLPWLKLIVRAHAATDRDEALAVQTVEVQPFPKLKP